MGQERSRCALECIEAVERQIEAHADTLAAVFLEPAVQGAAGLIVHPPEFLARVAEATKRAGALLVLDEVAVGFGRSGETLFACQQAGIEPDILCVAKGLTGGYLPLAATLTSETIFQAFLGPPEEGRTFFHGHTYTGNPLGAAAALATLRVFDEEDVLAGLPEKVLWMTEGLDTIRNHRHVGDVRQWGLMAGIELVEDRANKKPFDSARRMGMDICRRARKHGVFLRPLGDVVVVMPPLSIKKQEMAQIFEAIADGLKEAFGEGN